MAKTLFSYLALVSILVLIRPGYLTAVNGSDYPFGTSSAISASEKASAVEADKDIMDSTQTDKNIKTNGPTITKASHGDPEMLTDVVIKKTEEFGSNIKKQHDVKISVGTTTTRAETTIQNSGNKENKVVKETAEHLESKNSNTDRSTVASTTDPGMLKEAIVNETLQAPGNDSSDLSEGPLTLDETIESSDKAENNSCVAMDVRICVGTDKCKWFTAKCTEVNTNNIFPISFPNNLTDTIRFVKEMWNNPPSTQDPIFWLYFLVGSFVTASLLAMVILVTLLIWFIYLLIWAIRSCCNKNKKKKEKRRRLVILMPDSKDDEPSGDFIVDCSQGAPRTKRLGRTADLFRIFHASRSNNSLVNDRENWSTVGMSKDDLECPPNWQYGGDENSSIVTATICRKSRMSASQMSSYGLRASFSDDGTNGDSQSCSNFVNPAFSVSSINDGVMSPKHVVANDAEWNCEGTSDSYSISDIKLDDDDDYYADASGNLELPAVVSAIDETTSATNMTDEYETISNKCDSDEFHANASCAADELRKRNVNKLPDLQQKLKKAAPPIAPVSMKKNAVIEKEEEVPAKETVNSEQKMGNGDEETQ